MCVYAGAKEVTFAFSHFELKRATVEGRDLCSGIVSVAANEENK
jgi:hypothetical protein